jgi:hypothetical membrane protein
MEIIRMIRIFFKKALFLLAIFLVPYSTIFATEEFSVNGQSDLYLTTLAVGLLGTSLFAAHLAAPDSYSWKTNTISDLGAQNYGNAAIMRAGFISFGTIMTGAAIWDTLEGTRPLIQTLPVIVYGASVALTGFFSTAPFDEAASYSIAEENIHSIFANIAGIALTAAITGSAITSETPGERIFHLAAMGFVTLSSAMFMLHPEKQGVWQRVLWAGSLSWLTITFS